MSAGWVIVMVSAKAVRVHFELRQPYVSKSNSAMLDPDKTRELP